METPNTNPFSHLFSTNVPPSHIEQASLRQGVDSIMPWVILLRGELMILEEKLRLYRTALSPTRYLPAEILHEIFGLLDLKTLLTASMVCRAWHSASIVTSSTTISSTTIRFRPFEDGIPCHRVRSWLAKPVRGTKVLRLEHEIPLGDGPCVCYKSTMPCPWSDPDFARLFQTAPEEFKRLRLELGFSSPSCLLQVLASVGKSPSWHSIQALRLNIGTSLGAWKGRHTKYRNILSGLPSALKDLHLELSCASGGKHRNAPQIDIPKAPFKNLKTLVVGCIYWSSPLVLPLLSNCVELESICLLHWDDKQSQTEPVAKVSLPKVQRLELMYPIYSDPEKTLGQLRLPSLTDLKICRPDYSPGDPHIGLMRTLSSLGLLSPTPTSRLTTLALRYLNEDDPDCLWNIFSYLQSLHHLVLEDSPFNAKGFFDAYSNRTKGGTQLLPNLRTLKLLRPMTREGLDLGSFLLFVRHHSLMTLSTRPADERGQGAEPSSLRHIEIDYGLRVSSATLEGIRKGCFAEVDALRRDFGAVVYIT